MQLLHLTTWMISGHRLFPICFGPYATLEEKNPKLFNKVADHIASLEDLDRFDAQAFSNILWAYATAGESHPKLFKKVAEFIVTLEDLDKFNEQELSNTVWAYATAKESYPELFKKSAIILLHLTI